MLHFRRKAGPVIIHHKHNYTKIDYSDALRFVFYYRIRTDQNYFGFVKKNYYTIDNVLNKPIKEIFNDYSSTVKNEIRRSEKENVKTGFISSIDEFLKFHNTFASAKGVSKADRELLFAYKSNLLITCASLGEKILCAHAYILDKDAGITRLLFSSSIRFTENANLNSIGRANKYLHYKDMEYFINNGYLIYDFGGYANNTLDKQRDGINKFKLSFGGEIVRYYDYQSFFYWISSALFYFLLSIKKVKSK